MTILTIILTAVISYLLGIISLFVYAFLRGRGKNWDTSNLINPIRFYAHVILHPEDFPRMRYEDGSRPFWYLSRDEFKEIVKSRPKEYRK